MLDAYFSIKQKQFYLPVDCDNVVADAAAAAAAGR
jgi:hypothetical protein